MRQRSPGSRSAPWEKEQVDSQTPKGFHDGYDVPHIRCQLVTCTPEITMPQSLVQIYLHLVFSTKGRATFLKDEELRDRTHRYLAGSCKNLNSPALAIGGVEDHVHILCRLGKSIQVADLVRELKRESSRWIRAEFEGILLATRIRGVFDQPGACG